MQPLNSPNNPIGEPNSCEPKVTFQSHELADASFGEVASALASRDWRQVAKEIFYALWGTDTAVRGLGFELSVSNNLNERDRELYREGLSRIDQSGLPWSEKLACGALNTKLGLGAAGPEYDNGKIISYLKSHSEPGDIIFTSGEGANQTAIGEIFENVYRRVSSRAPGDERFPFTHAMVNVGGGDLVHINFRGMRQRTWERLFLERNYYESIAIGRLELPKQLREKFAEDVKKYAEGKKYNYYWALVSGPIGLLFEKWGGSLRDTSATKNRVVCYDIVTEAAKQFQKEGLPICNGVAEARTPIELFSASGLKITEAVTLQRDSKRTDLAEEQSFALAYLAQVAQLLLTTLALWSPHSSSVFHCL